VGPLGLTAEILPGLLGPEPLFSLPLGAYVSETQEVGEGACDAAFPAKSGTRIVAGGPLSDDVIKCRRKRIDADDYAVGLSPAQLDELRAIFPSGVCDYSRPGFGEGQRSTVWASIGANKLRPLHGLRWTTARSR
jgi:hypothetical protein